MLEEDAAPYNKVLFTQNTNQENSLVEQAKQRIAEKKLLNEQLKDANEDTNEYVVDTEISKENFDAAWVAYLNELDIKGNRRITSFLKNRTWQIIENNKVKINLNSNLEKEMFEAERLTVLPFFRSRLKNRTFEFEYEITNNSSNENVLLTAEQKFKLMAQKNSLLSDMQRMFELQIEY